MLLSSIFFQVSIDLARWYFTGISVLTVMFYLWLFDYMFWLCYMAKCYSEFTPSTSSSTSFPSHPEDDTPHNAEKETYKKMAERPKLNGDSSAQLDCGEPIVGNSHQQAILRHKLAGMYSVVF